MGKVHMGTSEQVTRLERTDDPIPPTITFSEPIVTTVYVDRPVEVIKEIEREVIKYIDRPIDVIKETIKEVFVDKPRVEYITQPPVEVIKYIESPKIHDITAVVDLRREKRLTKRLKVGIALSLVLNLIIVLVR